MATKNKKTPGRPLKGEALRVRCSFTLDPKLVSYLKKEAADREVSVSEFLEESITACLEESEGVEEVIDGATELSRFLRLRGQLETVLKGSGVARLSLFGSTLYGEDTPESDIDLLVEFQAGCTPGLFELARMEQKLSAIFGGRKVDLRTKDDLSHYFRDQVVAEAVLIYDQ